MDIKRKKSYTIPTYGVNVAKPKPLTPIIHKVSPPLEIKRKLQPFSGIQNIVSENYIEDNDISCLSADNLIEDDDFEPAESDINKQILIKPIVCGALSSLMCDYGSSDDENKDQKNDKCVTKPESKQIETSEASNSVVKDLTYDSSKSGSEPLVHKNAVNKSDDDSGPEEIKTMKPNENLEGNVDKKMFEPHSKIRQSNQRLNTYHQFRRPKVKLPSTLLTKLLRREMEQERNIILQCIRYVIKNNYFEDNKIV